MAHETVPGTTGLLPDSMEAMATNRLKLKRAQIDLALFDYAAKAAAEHCDRLRKLCKSRAVKATSLVTSSHRGIAGIVFGLAGAAYRSSPSFDEVEWRTDPLRPGRTA